MAYARAKTPETFHNGVESHNGWTVSSSESKPAVENGDFQVGGAKSKLITAQGHTQALTPVIMARFWAFVHKTKTCWLWRGSTVKGYGQFTVSPQLKTTAHRVSWVWHFGRRIPAGLVIMHTCDVPRCVRPAHLRLGTQGDNVRDASTKGHLHVARPKKRQLSAAAMRDILTAPQVRGVGNRLAEKHGITKAYVSLLRRGLRQWVERAS